VTRAARTLGVAAGAALISVLVGAAVRSVRSEEQEVPPGPSGTTASRTGSFVLDCRAEGRAISPLIYGIGGADGSPWATGATARRWGGNPTTRYNWRLNTWNLTKDWFFRNTGDSNSSYQRFLDENRSHGVKTALTLPMLGWVAKDASSYSFPVSVFGPQEATGPDVPD
jgi:hypothetical protein